MLPILASFGQRAKQIFYLSMDRLIVYCLAVAYLVLCSAPVYASYSRNYYFGTTRITYDELMQVIDKTHNLFEQRNATSDERISNEKLSIGDGKRTVRLTNQIKLNTVKELPKVAYSISYLIDSNNPDSPISSVQFDFGDFNRTLTIEGTNSEEVDALFSLLRDEMDKYSYFIGGPTFRIVGGLAFLILLGIVAILFLNNKWVSQKVVVIYSASCLIIAIALLAMPFQRWLAGFVVYDPNSSFLVKYSALFTFLSFIALPIPFIGRGILGILTKRKEEEQKTERIESKIGDALQKVEEIKKSPCISYGDLSVIEADIRKSAEEFFANRDAKMLSKKQAELAVETKEMRLNSEWYPVYLFLVNGLIKLLESYNEKLTDTEKISFTIPALPRNIFSAETNSYKGSVKFSYGATMSISFVVTRTYENESLPTAIFFMTENSSSRIARWYIRCDPDKKTITYRSSYDDLIVGIKDAECEVKNENYKSFFLDFFKKIIEHQLMS